MVKLRTSGVGAYLSCVNLFVMNTKCGLATGPKFYYKRLLIKTKEIMLVNDPTSKVTIAWGHNTNTFQKKIKWMDSVIPKNKF